MPDISGIDFIQYVKKKYPDIVCIIVTGYADKQILKDTVNSLDIFWHIEKSWDSTSIKMVIDNAINKYNYIIEAKITNEKLRKALGDVAEFSILKRQFLCNISHEIRTPLNGIVGFTRLIQETEDRNSISNEYFDIISDSSFKLISVIDDIILASRLQAGSMHVEYETVFLNNLLDDLYDDILPLTTNKQNIHLKVSKRIGIKKIPITTDREKLYYIFFYLLNNALKFTNTGEIEFGICDEENQVLFVKDSGSGISDEDKLIIFDFFKQGKQKYLGAEIDGLGIGLSIVKGLIQLLDGNIWLESEKGMGTTFYFQLPSKL